ncbi:MAG: DUF1631 family protein [Proteobacteria bacterium]|jgi:hypothetical protein|nr:DUF1631 family protein [Pseudomonadota bacterium]MDA1300162.1 DUF1631 family protein [Pseudomonadota bacterium]
MSATPQTVRDALRGHYIRQPGQGDNTSQDELTQYLRSIPEEQLTDGLSLADLIVQGHPDWRLTDDDRAILISIDDCTRMIFRLTEFAPEIRGQLQRVIPELACRLLENPTIATESDPSGLLGLLDLLVDASVGWTDDLGRAGQQLLSMIEQIVTSIRTGNDDYQALQSDLAELMARDQNRVNKLEQRLIASETGRLRSQRSKIEAARLINEQARGKSLTPAIISFLHGPWYDSLQILLLRFGLDSPEWFRAGKLTETLIWTYQPIDNEDEEVRKRDQQRLYRIIENLPGEIRDLLLALEADAVDEALGVIENEHVQIMSGFELETEQPPPIAINEEAFNHATTVSRILLRKVTRLEPGQWFIFEEGGREVRIKLALMLSDIKQLVYTNRNGMKALQKSFDEIAYYLSSSVIRPINHQDVFSTTYANYYNGIVASYHEKQQRVAAAEQAAKREAAAQEAADQQAIDEAKTLAQEKEQAEKARLKAEQEARMAHAREQAEKAENAERVREMTDAVHGLHVGARLRLPRADGVLDDCKLAVKLAAADKMIFVNQSGMKVGDYTNDQLVQLLVAGLAEIQEAGVEFEDTLAQVVTKLRSDRNKSYDDLTGA